MLLFAMTGMAQSTRLIRGFAQKEEGRPIIGATVTVVDEGISGKTAAGGAFELRVSPYARYVEVSYEGFRTVRLEIDGSLLIAKLKVDPNYLKAKAEEARAMVIQAEAEVPKAMAEAFRNGNLGIMDYYRMKNIQADTQMRDSIANADGGCSCEPLDK